MKGAILDLGSNTFKFLLAEQRKKRLRVYEEKAFPTRLGEGLALTGVISEAAINRSLRVLGQCRKQSEAFGADKLVVTGTSAIRSAKNRKDFLEKAKDVLGTSVKIISGKKEAELVYAGICSHPKWPGREIVDLDVGGGSVEIIHGLRGELLYAKSYPLGVVRLRDRFLSRYPLETGAIDEARRHLRKALAGAAKKLKTGDGFYQLATGGSMATLAGLVSLEKEPRSWEGYRISLSRIEHEIQRLASMKIGALNRMPGIPPKRSDILVPGLLLFSEFMQMVGVRHIHYATRGLRYGVWQRMVCAEPFSGIIYQN